MAIPRAYVKVGGLGKAGPHAAYIAREGQYAHRLNKGEKLEAVEVGNMPAWAEKNPQAFWQAADVYERVNGTTYREFEIALPRELTREQNVALVREFVRQEIGDRHAYQWAMHNPKAADGGDQPHAHVMFSERQRDAIERDPTLYFKRYNGKNPERGGACKGYGPNAGKTLTKAERNADLEALRGRWGDMCNAHLEKAGFSVRIDMRSHAEQQSGLVPERKLLPSEWRDPAKRAQVIEFRQARAELASARENLSREIPDAGTEIISLQAERDRRAQPEKRAEGLAAMIEQLREKTKDARPLMSGAEALEAVMKAREAKDPAKAKEAAERAAAEAAGRRATEQQRQNTERENRESQQLQNDPAAARQRQQEQREQWEQREQQRQAQRMDAAKRDEAAQVIKQPSLQAQLAKLGIDPTKKAEPAKQPSLQEQLAKLGVDPTKQAEPAKQKTVQEQIAAQEQKRLERMTPSELRAETAKVRPEPLEDAVKKSPEVVKATERTQELASVGSAALAQRDQATKEAEEWRQEHPLKAKAHDAGWKQSDYLNERAQVIEQAEKDHRETLPKFEEAKAEQERVSAEARERIALEQAERNQQADALEQRAQDKEQGESEAAWKEWSTDRGKDEPDMEM